MPNNAQYQKVPTDNPDDTHIEPQIEPQITLESLKKWHLVFACIHSVLFIACAFLLGFTATNSKYKGVMVHLSNEWPVWDKNATTTSIDKRVPIFPKWNYCNQNDIGDSAKIQCAQPNTHLDLPLAGILLATQLCTTAGHWLQFYLLWKDNNLFIAFTKAGIKIIFWLEYTFSASFIAVITSYLSGYTDVKLMLLIISSQSTLMVVGLLLDILRHIKFTHREVQRIYPFVFPGTEVNIFDTTIPSVYQKWLIEKGSFFTYKKTVLFIFLIGFFNLSCQWGPPLNKLREVVGSEGGPDSYIFGLYSAEFVLYVCFGIVQLVFMFPRSTISICFIRLMRLTCSNICETFSKQPLEHFTQCMLIEHNVHTTLSMLSKAVLVIFFAAYFYPK